MGEPNMREYGADFSSDEFWRQVESIRARDWWLTVDFLASGRHRVTIYANNGCVADDEANDLDDAMRHALTSAENMVARGQ